MNYILQFTVHLSALIHAAAVNHSFCFSCLRILFLFCASPSLDNHSILFYLYVCLYVYILTTKCCIAYFPFSASSSSRCASEIPKCCKCIHLVSFPLKMRGETCPGSHTLTWAELGPEQTQCHTLVFPRVASPAPAMA